jgi:hypothetical protein
MRWNSVEAKERAVNNILGMPSLPLFATYRLWGASRSRRTYKPLLFTLGNDSFLHHANRFLAIGSFKICWKALLFLRSQSPPSTSWLCSLTTFSSPLIPHKSYPTVFILFFCFWQLTSSYTHQLSLLLLLFAPLWKSTENVNISSSLVVR